jgi:hypothetical protein
VVVLDDQPISYGSSSDRLRKLTSFPP